MNKTKTGTSNEEARARRNSHWSADEIALLRAYYPSRGNFVALVLPSRSASSCCSQAQRLGIRYDRALPKVTTKADMVLDNCERWFESSLAEDATITSKMFDDCGEKLSEQDIVWLVRIAMYLASSKEMRAMSFRKEWYTDGCKYFALNAKEMQRHWDILHPTKAASRDRTPVDNAKENPRLCEQYKR